MKVSVVRIRWCLLLSHLRATGSPAWVWITGLVYSHTAGARVAAAVNLRRHTVDVFIALAYLAVLHCFNMNHTK